jgi:uncharacterized integral membrane protein (TIGR00698 family)
MKRGAPDIVAQEMEGGYPLAGDLYGDVPPPAKPKLREYLPGLLIAGLATLAAAFIAERYGAPLTMMALLIGLALNFLGGEARLAPGLTFASRTLLRVSIVLLGTRVTSDQMAALGPVSLGALILIVAATMLTGIAIARWSGSGTAFGTLAGGAVAICGASAALALATLLGERRISQAQLALVLVGIAGMSALSMVLYPILAQQLDLGDTEAGFLLGASIHEVAHSLGAGFSFSEPAGDVATIVKMGRVALLAPALLAVGLVLGGSARGAARLPWFVIGFFLVAGLNSAGFVPAPAGAAARDLATALLSLAVAATGIRSPMHTLLDAGLRPLLAILGASLAALLLSLAAILLLI